ncbi:MAG: hypothetical protein JOZ14_08115 [Acidobacteria bacterium]|nr:hypothetical protein [Acidobacteriota bacterium]
MAAVRHTSLIAGSYGRLLFCALILLSQPALASDWREPETQLAEEIVHVNGPGVISLEINNRSSISAAAVEEIRRALVSLLASRGVRVWLADQATSDVKIFFSENLENYVWVAEIRQGSGDLRVVLVSSPRSRPTPTGGNLTPLRIEVSALISQPSPILDAAIVEGRPQRLIVLGRTVVALYEFRQGRWAVFETLPIHTTNPLPRDLRGRIILRRDHLFDAYLPGLTCRSTASTALSITCLPGDEAWPIETADTGVSAFFSRTQNFFTGALVPGIGKQTTAPAFYCAARIPQPNYTLWLFTGVEGEINILDGVNHEVMRGVGWGSDIAGTRASCRSDRQVLVTSPASEGADSLEAYGLSNGTPVPLSQKLSLSGPVTALWTAQNGDSVTAVYRNLQTGDYEAVQLKLACSQ